jgi:hypothetical protein
MLLSLSYIFSSKRDRSHPSVVNFIKANRDEKHRVLAIAIASENARAISPYKPLNGFFFRINTTFDGEGLVEKLTLLPKGCMCGVKTEIVLHLATDRKLGTRHKVGDRSRRNAPHLSDTARRGNLMMLAPLFINLTVAAVAICLTFNTKEEVVKVAAIFIAGLSLFLCLFFAPLLLKLLILVIPFLLEKLHRIKRWQGDTKR